MKTWGPQEIRNRINEIIPYGKVIPRHTEFGHFYGIVEGGKELGPYPSVTTRLQALKDDSLKNYKLNRAMEYVFTHHKEFDEMNIMEHIEIAKNVTQEILEDAGDVGTRVHDIRQAIFKEWIKTGVKPIDFLSFLPPEEVDIRVISCIRALRKFVDERDYTPVACELFVFNHQFKVAGTLDDLGLMRQDLRAGDQPCDHKSPTFLFGYQDDNVVVANGKHTCMKCNQQWRYQFVLMDLKTSNQFKDHYFFQVAIYWWMFWRLMGIAWKPEKCFIVKVSKEDGSYKLEDLKFTARLAAYARAMLKTNEGIDFIKSIRKDNQKTVLSL